MVNAAEIAGIKVLSVLNEDTAGLYIIFLNIY